MRCKTTPYQRQQTGFTLLEIMLALGLTSMLMLGAISFLQQGVMAWTKSDAIITESERELIAMNFLRKTVAGAYAVEVESDEEEGKTLSAFLGQGNAVYLVGNLPVHHGKPMGLYLFGFMLENVEESDYQALIVKYWPVNWQSLGETQSVEPEHEVLLEGVESLSLEYFGNVAEPMEEPLLEWSSDWIEKSELPMAVRLNLTRRELNESEERPALPNWQNIYIKVAHRYIK